VFKIKKNISGCFAEGMDMRKEVDVYMLKARHSFLLWLFNVKFQVVLQIQEASVKKNSKRNCLKATFYF
jgi:hypothetical protein